MVRGLGKRFNKLRKKADWQERLRNKLDMVRLNSLVGSVFGFVLAIYMYLCRAGSNPAGDAKFQNHRSSGSEEEDL